MTKPVTGQTTFGSNTTGTTTQLDNNFLLAYNALNDLNTYSNFLTDTGSANTVVVTLAANLTGALTNGLVLQIKVAATNTGASTLNYNSGGALNILNIDGTALSAGQLVTGGICQFQYRSSDTSWLLQTPALFPSVAASGGGSLVLLSAKQANANANISFTSVISSTYDQYVLRLTDVVPQNANVNLHIKVSTDNGGNYIAGTNYRWASFNSDQTGANGSTGSAACSIIVLAPTLGNAANAGLSGEITLTRAASFRAKWQMSYITGLLVFENLIGTGMEANANANAIQLIASSGNIASGNFALYGVKRA